MSDVRPASDALGDEDKLKLITELVLTMSPEAKRQVIVKLAEQDSWGEVKLQITSNEEVVRLDFGRPLAWFAIPKDQAIQLGAMIMTHAGAHIEQVIKKHD